LHHLQALSTPCSTHTEKQQQLQIKITSLLLTYMACEQDLPQELWTQILQHVPYKHRLSSCALMCHKLSKLAALRQQQQQRSRWS
jgi:hypothetical protein